jgi:hypothetical protein
MKRSIAIAALATALSLISLQAHAVGIFTNIGWNSAEVFPKKPPRRSVGWISAQGDSTRVRGAPTSATA